MFALKDYNLKTLKSYNMSGQAADKSHCKATGTEMRIWSKVISQIVPEHRGFSLTLAEVTHENENKSPLLQVCDTLIHSSDL